MDGELNGLLEEARRQDYEGGPLPDDEAVTALLGARDARRARRKAARRAGVALVVLVAAFAAVRWTGPTTPLAYRVDSELPGESGWIARRDHARLVVFEDGTRFRFEPESHGRIGDRTARGAQVLLGQGGLHADVEPGGAWTVVAGPYTVTVTGTRFAVTWDSDEGSLEVSLYEGSVVVDGVGFEDGLALRAGQVLRAHAGSGSLQVQNVTRAPPGADGSASANDEAAEAGRATSPPSEEAPEPAADATTEPGADDATESDAQAEARTHQPSSRARARRATPVTAEAPSEPPPSLETLAGEGRFDEVLERLRGDDLDAVLRSAPRADLVAIADAGRYGAQPRLAERALETLRARFPHTPSGRSAAFLLGRLAEEHGGEAGRALGWYTTYLRESPRGPLAPDALWRKMRLETRMGRSEAARRSAATYLERHPDGPHAANARRVIDASPAP